MLCNAEQKIHKGKKYNVKTVYIIALKFENGAVTIHYELYTSLSP